MDLLTISLFSIILLLLSLFLLSLSDGLGNQFAEASFVLTLEIFLLLPGVELKTVWSRPKVAFDMLTSSFQ